MEIYGMCAFAVLCCVLCIILKEVYPSLAILLSVLGAVLIFLAVSVNVKTVIDFAAEIVNKTEMTESFSAAIKGAAVVLVTEFSADICEKAGEAHLGKALCTAGKLEIIIVALPLFRALMETALDLCL